MNLRPAILLLALLFVTSFAENAPAQSAKQTAEARNRMVDAIVSTGANIVDQDFFEGLGFKHYVASERLKAGLDDEILRDLHIDRLTIGHLDIQSTQTPVPPSV